MKNRAWLVVIAGVMVASCAGTTTSVARSIETPTAARPVVAHLGNADPLMVDVYPRIVSNEGNAWVRLRVEPDPRSVSVDVEWWSLDGIGGAHQINLEGDRAAIRHQYGLKRLDPGEYEVTAVLTRSDGTRVRRSTTITVVGTR